jgi:lipopolysaccharide transport system ATP-binding protein
MATIAADGLSKRYRIGELQRGYGTLRDSVVRTVRRIGQTGHRHHEEIWALKDVSFEVQEGEVLGLIGRNGAGKSTLLKVLTRITTPTAGRAVIRGRVGSLLEVGTGFHPELTGRENVFLNGAILGMKRREIQRKLPDIIEFSGIEQFLDTPVKRYSSGMFVRLAFSVAAHLEPEILLVDEVLAVGDAEFQRRSLGRMEDLGGTGRTVVFVSHNMQAIAHLCDRAILLDEGKVIRDGPSSEVVAHYLQTGHGSSSEAVYPDLDRAPGNHVVRIRGVRVVNEDSSLADAVDVRRPVGIEIAFTVLSEGEPLFPKIKVFDSKGEVAFNAIDTSSRWEEPAEPGDHLATAWIPPNLLNEGLVTVDVDICSIGLTRLIHHAAVRDLLSFHVQDPGEGGSASGAFRGQLKGAVRPLLNWSHERTSLPS